MITLPRVLETDDFPDVQITRDLAQHRPEKRAAALADAGDQKDG
jgi:hypothetical protein